MKRGALLIDKYIRKGLSPEERYELEKLALDDPLLAEAWEGLSAPYAIDNLAATQRLDNRLLDKSKRSSKVIPLHKKLWPYAVAASLALVMAIGILLRQDSPGENGDVYATAPHVEEDRYTTDASVAMISEEVSTGESTLAVVQSTEANLTEQVVASKKVDDFALARSTSSEGSTHRDISTSVSSKESMVAQESDNDKGAEPRSKRAPREATTNNSAAARSAKVGNTPPVVAKDMMAARTVSADELASNHEEKVVMIDKNLKATTDDGTRPTHQEIEYSDTVISISSEELATVMDMPVTFINDTMKEESTKKKTEEYSNKGKKRVVVPVDEVSEKISMPSTPINPIIEPMPAVGLDEYDKLLNDQVDIPKDEFFMRGIKDYMPIYVLFQVNEKGMPIDVKFSKDPSLSAKEKQQIIKAFETVSPWKDAPTGTTLSYTLKLRAD